MSVTRAKRPTKNDKHRCFAYKLCRNGEMVLCTALSEINCVNCAFFKDITAYKKELVKCEQRNRALGIDEKYKNPREHTTP